MVGCWATRSGEQRPPSPRSYWCSVARRELIMTKLCRPGCSDVVFCDMLKRGSALSFDVLLDQQCRDIAQAVLQRAGAKALRLAITPWLVHELRLRGLDVICLDARHARAALRMQLNKTGHNDAEGLAQIMRTWWYRAVHVTSFEPVLVHCPC